MADASVPAAGAPREVRSSLGELTRRVRVAQSGAWFPLLLLGLLTLGGILVGRLTFEVAAVPCPPADPAPGTGCTMVSQGSPLYWPVGLALACAATAVFYHRRSRGCGVGTPVRPYLLTGIPATSPWSALPRFGVPGVLLLLGGSAFLPAERAGRRDAS
ncbi:hypothetical protein [Kitasatospora sp. NPDC094015]|uniref:hypothetical protein n=1 Tax=Kitasatospora sp. NPDC094015 TaxID=3155205 RepID=UPI003327FCFC